MTLSLYKKSYRCIILCCVAAAGGVACVKLPRRAASLHVPAPQTTRPAETSASPININKATRQELERLPGIGPALAARIVEHRERYGSFRRVEHLLLVRGISERRFRQLRPHVTPE
ncbi:MAG: helix-hairpin-helix domain-containing protein [Acidobacteria bacterium]|nr:helix-hairpin-helix domain-containing protein [Acidobacteriota bacterium]